MGVATAEAVTPEAGAAELMVAMTETVAQELAVRGAAMEASEHDVGGVGKAGRSAGDAVDTPSSSPQRWQTRR